MARDVDDRRFRDVEKTLADVGSAADKSALPGPLDLDITTRGHSTTADSGVKSGTGGGSDPEATRLASRRREPFRIGTQWAGRRVREGGLSLVPTAPPATEAYSIVVDDEFKIGRSGGEVDLVTWILPRSQRNDALTRRISRVHAKARLEAGRLWVSDCGTANGTTLDSVAVGDRAALPSATHSELVLGGEYHIVVDPLPTPFPNLEIEEHPCAFKDAPCGAVRFHPNQGPGPERKPIWLLRQVAFGSGRGCGMRLDAIGVADVEGLFCLAGQTVWIGLLGVEGSILLDGVSLRRGELAPIKEYKHLKIGPFLYSIEGP